MQYRNINFLYKKTILYYICSHINLGKNFQARVKKWADREITIQEREALPDRDEVVFDSSVIDHLPQSASKNFCDNSRWTCLSFFFKYFFLFFIF